jgi:hypothetical protein
MRLKIGFLLLLLPLVLVGTPACQQSATEPASEETANAAPLAQSDKDTYTEGETVTVTYSNLPGNEQDWISVTAAAEPDDTYGEWFYTQGATEGTYTFNELEPGEYEVRVYFNWPDGDFEVQDRYSFTVEADASEEASEATEDQPLAVNLDQESYGVDEPITIEYEGLPGNEQDWITLVKASDPDDTYGEWFYTEGKEAGAYTFGGVEPGEYEVRVYYNWPDGDFEVQERISVVVE